MPNQRTGSTGGQCQWLALLTPHTQRTNPGNRESHTVLGAAPELGGEQWAAPLCPAPPSAVPTVPKRTVPGPLPSSSQVWERALDPITPLPCELAPSTGEARGRAAVMRGGGLGEPKLPPLAWHSGATDPPSRTHAPARLTPARATQY